MAAMAFVCFLNAADVARQQQDVVAGLKGGKFAGTVSIGIGDTLHIQAIGDNQTVKPQLLTQQTTDDGGAERRGSLAVEGVDLQVCGHHAADACGNHTLEGVKVDSVDILRSVVYHGEFEVAVGLGVAVAREMFGHSHHTHAL